mmetsp:Transcript_86598/g.250066  ORF Transcript_86598/g.250066 Transcript_86598/m.250066 type:complete len:209 (-) Transcript_86598:2292-2918(-)
MCEADGVLEVRPLPGGQHARELLDSSGVLLVLMRRFHGRRRRLLQELREEHLPHHGHSIWRCHRHLLYRSGRRELLVFDRVVHICELCRLAHRGGCLRMAGSEAVDDRDARPWPRCLVVDQPCLVDVVRPHSLLLCRRVDDDQGGPGDRQNRSDLGGADGGGRHRLLVHRRSRAARVCRGGRLGLHSHAPPLARPERRPVSAIEGSVV